jgi:hypothetical protein
MARRSASGVISWNAYIDLDMRFMTGDAIWGRWSGHGSASAELSAVRHQAVFKLDPGRYDVSATIGGETRTGVVFARKQGRSPGILRFLNPRGAKGIYFKSLRHRRFRFAPVVMARCLGEMA